MPTPFTHLAYAQRMLADDGLTEPVHHLLQNERPAFLLGSIAADAQTIHGLKRETTHFYSYDQPLDIPPYQTMLQQNPGLYENARLAQRAFIAGYILHLSIDEIWSQQMIYPYFVVQTWGAQLERFLGLQLLLISMDERDRAALTPETIEDMGKAFPEFWLPFLNDEQLLRWKTLIQRQLAPGGQSETLAIVSERAPAKLELTPQVLRDMLDSQEVMGQKLWSHVPRQALIEVETRMYEVSRTRLNELPIQT